MVHPESSLGAPSQCKQLAPTNALLLELMGLPHPESGLSQFQISRDLRC